MANERVQTNAAEQVVLKLKTPWRDGTTHMVMSPLEFMPRAATLTCLRSSAASGLTIPIHHFSDGPAPRAAGIGCARGFRER